MYTDNVGFSETSSIYFVTEIYRVGQEKVAAVTVVFC